MKNYLQNRLHITEILPYIGFAVFVLAVKFAIIANYGNATPYWDQWDAEADNLYRPLLEGSLHWMDLFAGHNEHRIFTTRLLALALLELNGKIWNPILQMQVNAVLHVASLSVLLFYLSKALSTSSKIALFVFSAVLFSIPFGWENTLAGFQSQFYFLLLFSFVFLWGMSAYKTYCINWWLGLLAGGLCLVTMASGAITVLAGSLILVARRLIAKDKEGVAISAIILLLIIAVIAISLTPSNIGHVALKAQSVRQFLIALVIAFSWPANKMGFVIIQVPALLIILRIFFNKEFHTPPYFFITAVILWLFGQFIIIAYGRVDGVTSSRYLDLFSIGLVINFVALIVFVNQANKKMKLLYSLIILVWLVTVVHGFFMSSGKMVEDLQIKSKQGQEQEKNVKAYLCSGDVTQLQDKPFLFIPYPKPERLKSLLDNPAIRSILPSNIYMPNSHHPVGADGEPFCDPGFLVRAFDVLNWKKTDNTTGFATMPSIRSNSWQGTDYFKSAIPGFQIVGSLIKSENDTGIITLHLHRGEKILYRSGPRVAGQLILINNGGEGKFYTALPFTLEWSILDFSKTQLPDEFDITLIDGGTKWGEWSAIALKGN
jgi:hypothetical protein